MPPNHAVCRIKCANTQTHTHIHVFCIGNNCVKLAKYNAGDVELRGWMPKKLIKFAVMILILFFASLAAMSALFGESLNLNMFFFSCFAVFVNSTAQSSLTWAHKEYYRGPSSSLRWVILCDMCDECGYGVCVCVLPCSHFHYSFSLDSGKELRACWFRSACSGCDPSQSEWEIWLKTKSVFKNGTTVQNKMW